MSENNEENGAEEDYSDEDDVLDENSNRAKFVFKLGNKEGHLEAPIDLNISTMIGIELKPLLWYNYDIGPKKIKLTNTGSTVILSAKWKNEHPYLIDGPLLGKYVFSQLHFHWGKNEMVGSEHYLDGCCMPMEVHAVHYNADYLSHNEALQHDDGITILVYMFRLQPGPNPALDQILDKLPQIREPNKNVKLTSNDPLVELLRPFSDDYFLYWGALTTPDSGLKQRVLWLVSRVPIPIAQEQK
ncbi:carbonic anhydrase 2-like [Copidosoma floridanum]|uniref:carbonic anhydrase 2-like n=1 Tax=Copidosoma floridanum TaxID=29053 RepID=UPI000C6F85DF|nr:carbonic anhydrase 2-like [Copidosoma floridanum]